MRSAEFGVRKGKAKAKAKAFHPTQHSPGSEFSSSESEARAFLLRSEGQVRSFHLRRGFGGQVGGQVRRYYERQVHDSRNSVRGKNDRRRSRDGQIICCDPTGYRLLATGY